MIIKKGKHRNIDYSIEIVQNKGTFVGCALDIFRVYKSQNDGFETLKEAEVAIKIKIDEFLEDTSTTYKELAKALTSSLVWTGYEDCYVCPEILKIQVEAFLKARK